MPTKKQNQKTLLSTWLFKRPIIFTVFSLLIMAGVTALFSGLKTWLNIESIDLWIILLIVSFGFSAYYFIIKKLPHTDMSRNDLIAIANGGSLIAITIPLVLLLFMGTDMTAFQHKMMWLYVLHPNMFMLVAVSIILLVLYLSGVAISGIYAKYKRAKTMGVQAWKIICSMPFTFLLIWMPGYLIEDKNTKSDLEIKSNWYSKFNNWVISDISNTLLVFLTFLLLRNIYSGLPLLLLTAALLLLYTVWNLKYKKTFIKNINKGYALMAVLINVTIIASALIFG